MVRTVDVDDAEEVDIIDNRDHSDVVRPAERDPGHGYAGSEIRTSVDSTANASATSSASLSRGT